MRNDLAARLATMFEAEISIGFQDAMTRYFRPNFMTVIPFRDHLSTDSDIIIRDYLGSCGVSCQTSVQRLAYGEV